STACTNELRCFASSILQHPCMTCEFVNFPALGQGPIVDRMIPDLTAVLEDITKKAPNAQIVLMGYPELLSRSAKSSGSLWFDMTEVQALVELVNYADTEQKPEVCLWGVGDGVCISRESFHPKSAGATGYADVMRKRLDEIGHTGS
ncbi:hypothetical protein ACFVYE_43975, partial [Streptomyces sp. NPDC058239]